jgi:hypothetical protein
VAGVVHDVHQTARLGLGHGLFNHFLEDVPYKESRDYCRITVSNFYAYEIMRSFHGM